ncbi:hypothetical protein LTR22_024919 [Elasticomyces elasticus]|nr:hypothetical protein LTR22_024919 [Elasticomyces elasticus]KAK4905307.1 hypothetical protein LTR49_025382 [Elasticomyces elasticus]KAK5742285.1 hypothetical protein LTS12_024299 [Elasticomyces elasticus]
MAATPCSSHSRALPGIGVTAGNADATVSARANRLGGSSYRTSLRAYGILWNVLISRIEITMLYGSKVWPERLALNLLAIAVGLLGRLSKLIAERTVTAKPILSTPFVRLAVLLFLLCMLMPLVELRITTEGIRVQVLGELELHTREGEVSNREVHILANEPALRRLVRADMTALVS